MTQRNALPLEHATRVTPAVGRVDHVHDHVPDLHHGHAH